MNLLSCASPQRFPPTASLVRPCAGRRRSATMAPRTLSLATATCAAAAAAAAAAYFYRRRRAATIAPRVLVASTSQAKLAAVKAALGAREVTILPAPSLVEDQPIGTDRCMRGLSNRLKSITAAAAEGYDYAVAIESGLMRLQCAPHTPPRHHATRHHATTTPPRRHATKQARRARTRATRPKPKPVPPHLPPPPCCHRPAATALPPPAATCSHRPAVAHAHRSLTGTGGPPERWLESAIVVVLNLRTGQG